MSVVYIGMRGIPVKGETHQEASGASGEMVGCRRVCLGDGGGGSAKGEVIVSQGEGSYELYQIPESGLGTPVCEYYHVYTTTGKYCRVRMKP